MSLVFSSLVSGMPWGLGSKKAAQMCLDHLELVMILKLVSGWASLNFHNFVKNMHISWRMFHLLPFIHLWAPSLRPDRVALLSVSLGLCYTSSPASLKAALLSGGFVPSFSSLVLPSFADYLRVTEMVLSVLDFPVFFFLVWPFLHMLYSVIPLYVISMNITKSFLLPLAFGSLLHLFVRLCSALICLFCLPNYLRISHEYTLCLVKSTPHPVLSNSTPIFHRFPSQLRLLFFFFIIH